MKLKREGFCEVALKLDMNKAYDRIEWDFLCATLVKLGFSQGWVERILWCLSSVNFSVMMSGKRVAEVTPKRGLRQGDPLSPYLFIVVNNVLSRLIEKGKSLGRLKGVSLGRGSPEISHSFFADDSVFFLRANVNYCRNLKDLIDLYCVSSGQAINFGKSCLYFSRNMPDLLREEVGQIFQVHAVGVPGNYLGLPIIWGRSKTQALNFVIDRMEKKIQGWRRNFLSEAGREVLIKSVANSLPVYSMSCFLYPKNVLNKLDSIVSKFWWKNDGDKRKIHWVAMEKLKRHKLEGGLGFKDFEAFNLALLAKVGWRILKYPNQIWARVLKARYFPRDGFLEARKGRRASWLWASILEGRKVLENQVCVGIGDGKSTRVWQDPWLGNLPGKRLSSPCPHESLVNLRVADLMLGDEWNLGIIVGWITEKEKEAICKTITAPRNREDKWVWTGGKRSVYSVKEGYRVARGEILKKSGSIPSSSNENRKRTWKEVWRLKVPYKVRNFVWRLMSNALPTFQNLWKRKCSVVDVCLICHKKIESLEHLFRFCEGAKATWFGSNFSFRPGENEHDDMSHWVSECLGEQSLDDWQKALFAMTLWQIWKARNAFIFENVAADPIFNFVQAGKNLQEFWEVQGWIKKENQPNRNEDQNGRMRAVWRRPKGNEIKINTDGAFWSNENKGAVVFVVRDSNGWVIDGVSRIIDADSAFMVEALAFLEAINFANENQLDDVCFESDNQVLIKCINKDLPPNDWRSVNILDSIHESRKLIRNHSCNWIPREANLVADWVAKASIGGFCPRDWVDYPPNQLRSLLDKEAGDFAREPD